MASISLAPVLSSSEKRRQEISYQTLQGQGKGPTVGMKRDRVKRKKAGKKKLHCYENNNGTFLFSSASPRQVFSALHPNIQTVSQH